MKLLDLIKQFGQANYNCGFWNQQSGEMTKKYEIERSKLFDEIVSQIEPPVKPAKPDIDEMVRQAKIKSAKKYLGNYEQSYIWAGDIEKFTKEMEEELSREIKRVLSV